MRHVKTMTTQFLGGPQNRPCDNGYTFKSPTNGRSYIKVLKFVEKHPGCKRHEIQKGVWGNVGTRGSHSSLFAQMLYADILDYNDKFEYKVTRKGKALLRKIA